MQIERHLVGGAAPLFCVFNSLKNPEFEFRAMFEHAWPVNALFFRQERPGWFLEHTDEIAATIGGVDHGDVFCCGHSSGGSTAIRIGALVGAKAVLAFSPQSSLSPQLNQGAAWLSELEALGSDLDIVDASGATACTVVFSTKCSPVDALHRDRFRAAGRARVVEYDSQRPEYCHRIPWEMKERGETRRFFEEVFPCLSQP